MNIAIVGLGKLGLPLACLHAQNNRVFGIDLDVLTVESINSGKSPIHELGLEAKLKHVVGNGSLTAHTDFDVVAQCDYILILVPTPSLPSGEFTSQYVIDAVEKVGDAIRWPDELIIPDLPPKVVVICSTVMPGECAGPITDALSKAANCPIDGYHLSLMYSPEFIALGSVLHDMKHPDVILIGESDRYSGERYELLCREIAGSSVPSRHMSLTSAEIAKISINSYVTMKLSFANSLGELCEHIPDADGYAVAEAIGLDRRVGVSYLRPGGPYGGPCFPRDNRAYSLAGGRVGVDLLLSQAADEINDHQIERAISIIETVGRHRVGILGASYKPGTRVTEESFGTRLAETLTLRGYAVTIYDPANSYSLDHPWTANIHSTTLVTACLANDMTTIIATPQKESISQFPNTFSDPDRQLAVVIDPWDCLPEGPWDDTNVIRMNRYAYAA